MKSKLVKEQSGFLCSPSLFGGAGWYAQILLSTLLLIFSFMQSDLLAQNKKRNVQSVESKRAEADTNLAKSREEFMRATKEYKNSLEQLIALYEKDVRKAEEKLTQAKQLYSEGLISRKN